MSGTEGLLVRAHGLLDRLDRLLPGNDAEPLNGDNLAWRWQIHGFARTLTSVKSVTGIRLGDLQCIDRQKDEIVRNTRQFLRKLPANHVLLWGPRGTGKSSLIKALLNEYGSKGLRLIEVEKRHLTDLALITEQVYELPQRFIIYCDDLSFDASDPSYRAIKVIIDGSVSATPENVLIYATSNRRHLLPEYMNENLQSQMVEGELHQSEAVDREDLALGTFRHVACLSSLQPGTIPVHRGLLDDKDERSHGQSRRHACGGIAMGAGTRLAQRPFRLAIRMRLDRQTPIEINQQ